MTSSQTKNDTATLDLGAIYLHSASNIPDASKIVEATFFEIERLLRSDHETSSRSLYRLSCAAIVAICINQYAVENNISCE